MRLITYIGYLRPSMTAVVFAFGDRPELSTSEAIELALLLEDTRTVAGFRAASQIRGRASRDPGLGETRSEVDLSRGQLRLMYNVLREVSPTFDTDAIVYLRLQLMRELNVASDT